MIKRESMTSEVKEEERKRKSLNNRHRKNKDEG